MKTIEPINQINGAEPVSDASESRAAPIRIWLVDDDDQLRDTLAEMLARIQGVECTRSFGSANAALSTLASKAGPDVILLDINIGKENGLDAVRPIRLLSRSTRVLMFTTFFDGDAKSRALQDGASGFLLKHYPMERIVESIRQAKSKPEPLVSQRRRARDKIALSSAPAETPGGNGFKAKSKTAAPALKVQIKFWVERIRNAWN